MKSLDEFFMGVRIDVPGIALEFMRDAIREAARDFCRRSHIWRVTRVFTLQPDVTEYRGLALPDNSEIVNVSYFGRKRENTTDPVKYDDLTKRKVTEDDLDFLNYGWRDRESTKAVIDNWGVTLERDGIFIIPRPTIAYSEGVKVRIVLMPGQLAFEVPDVLYTHWREKIEAGASANLLGTPGKPWTDLEASARRQKEFDKGVMSAVNQSRSAGTKIRNRTLGTGTFPGSGSGFGGLRYS